MGESQSFRGNGSACPVEWFRVITRTASIELLVTPRSCPMCWGVYIVTDRSLLEVPEGDPRFPAFTVREVEDERAAEVRRVTGLARVYYASSWQGCGCGFSYETDAEFREQLAGVEGEPALERLYRENRTAELASVRSLSRYVEAAGPLVIYAVDESRVGAKPTVRRVVEPSFFGGPSFNFGDGLGMFEPTGLYEIGAQPGRRAV